MNKEESVKLMTDKMAKFVGHIGNAKVYERTLHMLAKYDDKIEERLFSELDVKYINRFNLEMEKDG